MHFIIIIIVIIIIMTTTKPQINSPLLGAPQKSFSKAGVCFRLTSHESWTSVRAGAVPPKELGGGRGSCTSTFIKFECSCCIDLPHIFQFIDPPPSNLWRRLCVRAYEPRKDAVRATSCGHYTCFKYVRRVEHEILEWRPSWKIID